MAQMGGNSGSRYARYVRCSKNIVSGPKSMHDNENEC